MLTKGDLVFLSLLSPSCNCETYPSLSQMNERIGKPNNINFSLYLPNGQKVPDDELKPLPKRLEEYLTNKQKPNSSQSMYAHLHDFGYGLKD